ncbi:MAG: peptidylprolyl isomerase, partial [Geminicoccaceae bacterium]
MPVLVNGVEISDHAINSELQYHPAGSVEEAREEAARALAVRELLLQAAARRGIDRPDPPMEGQENERET